MHAATELAYFANR